MMKINKINTMIFFVIFITSIIVYTIICPSMFYSIKTALNPGYEKQ